MFFFPWKCEVSLGRCITVIACREREWGWRRRKSNQELITEGDAYRCDSGGTQWRFQKILLGYMMPHYTVFQEIDILARYILLLSQRGMLQYSSLPGVHKFLQRNWTPFFPQHPQLWNRGHQTEEWISGISAWNVFVSAVCSWWCFPTRVLPCHSCPEHEKSVLAEDHHGLLHPSLDGKNKRMLD